MVFADEQRVTGLTGVIYGARAGCGGLGFHASTVLAGLVADGVEVHGFGPGYDARWPLLGERPGLRLTAAPRLVSALAERYTSLRWDQGRLVYEHDCRLGRWAATQVERVRPDRCYAFTQVALETLRWARKTGRPSVLDNPNGHIRGYADVCRQESFRWTGERYRGHPSEPMIERVEEEYELADRIRVSSEWAKASMVERGIAAEKITVVPLPLDLARYVPPASRDGSVGPLRVCFVGSLDVRKGFVYLLQALRALPREQFTLSIVGATGSRSARRLFEREQTGLPVLASPGDPVSNYQRAELFVLPTLEDGFGLVVAEAMACGTPVVVTDACGASQLVRPGKTGWVVPAGRTEAIVDALREALQRRRDLPEMGYAARIEVERQMGSHCLQTLHDWFYKS